MLTCKQVIDLASISIETSLPPWQRWQFRFHLLICRHCRRYTKQLYFLQRLSFAMRSRLPSIALPIQARERIAKKLKEKIP